jgi:hypothetical protein
MVDEKAFEGCKGRENCLSRGVQIDWGIRCSSVESVGSLPNLPCSVYEEQYD